MKKLLLFACLGAASLAAKAQITSQRWQATIDIPSPTDCFISFDHDSLNLFMKDMPTDIVESMRFTLRNDTLTLVKLMGGSPCDNNPVTYKATVADNTLQLTKISDACDVRVNALVTQPWKPYTTGAAQ